LPPFLSQRSASTSRASSVNQFLFAVCLTSRAVPRRHDPPLSPRDVHVFELSSQLLENKQHFWALVPFHYGILAVLAGHIVAFLIPRQVLLFNSRPLRLYVLEVSALIFGISTLVGLVAIIARRMTDARVRVVTSRADWILYALLLLQVFGGVYVAVFHRWGSSWFAASAAVSLVAAQTESGHQRHRGDAADGQGAHRQRVAGDRVLPLHPSRAHPRRSESIPLAQAPGRAVVRHARPATS
jgi:nitrate reductase gamma subunit